MATLRQSAPRDLPDDPSRLRADAHDLRTFALRLAVIVALTVAVVAVWSEWGAAGLSAPAPVLQSADLAISVPQGEVRIDVPPTGNGAATVPRQPNAIPRPPELPEPAPPDEFIRFIVQPGDTLFDISTVYGVGIDDLLRFNPALGDGSLVDVGQLVWVPVFDE